MEKPAIIHLEDDNIISFIMSIKCDKENVDYKNLKTLRELEENLDSLYKEPCLFILDGNFPREEGYPAELLAGDAARIIKNKYPESSIVFYSGNPLIREIAKEYSSPFFIKGRTDPCSLLHELVSLYETRNRF